MPGSATLLRWKEFSLPKSKVPAEIKDREVTISYEDLAKYLAQAEKDERCPKYTKYSDNSGFR